MATRLPTVCLFCQSTSNITAEHVLPESWRKVFGASLFDRTDSGWLINSDGQRIEVEKTVKAKPFGRKVREVCGSCNKYGLAWPPVSSSMSTPPMVRHRYVQQYLEASVMR